MLRITQLSILLLFCIFLQAQEKKFSNDMLGKPRDYTGLYEKSFSIVEIPVFRKNNKPGQVVLETGYVQHIIKNPAAWQAKPNTVVTEINIVFTKYPKDKELWQTNYYDLLANRLKELFLIDSTLNNPNFEWNLVLQTECNTEEQAKKMFHGIVIRYVELSSMENIDRTTSPGKISYDSTSLINYSQKVERFIESQGGFGDSAVIKILNRNRDWDNALIVMDWTGSMYQYGAQAVQWHILNFSVTGLSFFTFFNDGDGKSDNLKVIGSTGGLYHVQASNIENLINTFYRVSAGGDGGDGPENDLEAVLVGMNKYKDFEELILIADNNSCVRDISLLSELDVPVHIILCGTQDGINPQYVNIAYKTGGSLHTIENDIINISSRIKDGKTIIRGVEYQLSASDVLICQNPAVRARFADCNRFESMHPPLTQENILPQIKIFIDTHGSINDSSPMSVFRRHPLWQEVAVTMQFLPSTYGNAAQVLLWQKLNIKNSGIKYYALCNDGDSKKEREKKDGRTGGVYLTKANNLRKVLNKMYYVEKRTPSASSNAFNAVEALMRTLAQYRKAQNLVLVASNQTCIRDIGLVELIAFPVKVVLMEVDGSINPQYINLAWKTGGSLHFKDEDYYEHVFKAAQISSRTMLIGGTEYILNKNDQWEFKEKADEKAFNNCKKYN